MGEASKNPKYCMTPLNSTGSCSSITGAAAFVDSTAVQTPLFCSAKFYPKSTFYIYYYLLNTHSVQLTEIYRQVQL